MPIVGLTDNIIEAFPKIGRLRKGAKKTQKNKPGPDLTYFRFTSERPEVEAAFYKAYGQEPRRISVVLPEPTADENFTTSKEEWTGSLTLLHRCDGVRVVRQFNKKTGEYENFPPGEGPFCPYSEAGGKERTEKNPGCTNRGRLRVVIPELVAAGYVGTVTFGTGGKHDIRSILAVLKKVESARRQKGLDLAWMPFVLYRAEEEVSSPAWEGESPDKRHKVTKSLVKIVPAENWVKAQIAQVQADYTPLLASGDAESEYIEVDEETDEIVEVEQEAPPPFAEDGGAAKERGWDEDTFDAAEESEKPKPTNGSRPLSPGKLKSFLISKAESKPETHQTAVATPGQKGLVAGKLAECFAPADDAEQKRRSVLLWLWGNDSTKDLTMAAAGATLDWLLDKDADEGTYDLHSAAPQEAQAVLKVALKEAGQQELEL